tara:strand:+ start:63335 stop:64075 length:741 start_codon:yes stop_codon:yes gene_type:complete
MLNWQIDPELVAPLVPLGTEIDFHDDKTYVSIVGFMFLDTCVLGMPIPFHRNFEELNLRFYVRRLEEPPIRSDSAPTIKRGVAFVSELVPRWAIAAVARRGYNEQYDAVPMRHSIVRDANDGSIDNDGSIGNDGSIDVEYQWKYQGRWNSIAARGSGRASPLVADSHEQFIAEHYWGYSQQRDGSTFEYQVKHVPWNVWQAASFRFDCDVMAQYGDGFAETLSRTPDSAFIADGSAVTVSRPRRIN